MFYAPNIEAATAGGTRVTVTFDRPARFVDLRITEYAGLRRLAPFDAGGSAAGAGTTADSGPVDTAAPRELLFAAGMTGTAFTAPGPGYTRRVITSPNGDIVEHAIGTVPGEHRATASLHDGTWLLQLAAFRAAG